MWKIGPLNISELIPFIITYDTAPQTQMYLGLGGLTVNDALMIGPCDVELHRYLKSHLYEALPETFLITDNVDKFCLLHPGIEELYNTQLVLGEAIPKVNLSLPTDLFFALIVDDILERYQEYADRFYNRDIIYPPTPLIFRDRVRDVETPFYVQNWIQKYIDMKDLDFLIRCAVSNVNMVDVLISAYRKYDYLFEGMEVDEGDDMMYN